MNLLKEQIDKVFTGVKKWQFDISQVSDSRMPPFCKSAYRSFSIDAASLHLDLQYMLDMLPDKKVQQEVKEKFDSLQEEKTGFYHEPFRDEELGDSPIERVVEMSGTYLGFQVGGSLRTIDRLPKYEFRFYKPFIGEGKISQYLEEMPWTRSPWGAGGWVDAVATMISLNILNGYQEYQPVLDEMFDWLGQKQDPINGLWGDGSVQGLEGLINGTYHLLRGTWFFHDKEVAYPEQIIDSVIELLTSHPLFEEGKGEGCHDLDTFYLLARVHRQIPSYRKNELNLLLTSRLKTLFNFQNPDGGFSFYPHRAQDEHNYYKVSPSYIESDIQGTVFYLTAIKSIIEILEPEYHVPWKYSLTHG